MRKMDCEKIITCIQIDANLKNEIHRVADSVVLHFYKKGYTLRQHFRATLYSNGEQQANAFLKSVSLHNFCCSSSSRKSRLKSARAALQCSPKKGALIGKQQNF